MTALEQQGHAKPKAPKIVDGLPVPADAAGPFNPPLPEKYEPPWYVPHPRYRTSAEKPVKTRAALVTAEDIDMMDKYLDYLFDVIDHVPRVGERTIDLNDFYKDHSGTTTASSVMT